jgi:mycothiol S-conjugate amidase
VPDEPLRLMAVHAHPDDESSKGAATLAKYAAEGVDVLVVSCTNGERGDVLNPKFQNLDSYDMKTVRRMEMANAAAALGVEHVWLGFEDSGWHEGGPSEWTLPDGCFGALDVEIEIAALVAVVRRFRPHVMTTYDENGGYPHADHIRCHVISVGAYEAAADPDRFPDAGEPWSVSKLYYNVGFPLKRMQILHDAAVAAELTSPFAEWLEKFKEREGFPDRTTTRISVAEFFSHRDNALRAHASQIDPDAHWFAIPHDLERSSWPTEEFELAQARIPTSLPEDDLFAGLRPADSSRDSVSKSSGGGESADGDGHASGRVTAGPTTADTVRT